MAFESKLGEAFVELRARRQKFVQDMKRARAEALSQTKSLGSQIGRSLGRLGPAAVAGGVVAASAAIAFMTKRAIASTAALADNAQKLGLSVEAYQELEFASSQAGIKTETFSMALQRFTRRVAEARQGTGEAKAALAELGITFTEADGSAKSIEQILNEVADAMTRVPNQADRVRLAFKLFDSEGVVLVNLLEQGSEGIERMREAARRLGLVLDGSMVAEARRAQAAMDVMGRVVAANTTRALLAFTPVVLAAAEAIGRFAPAISTFVQSVIPGVAGIDVLKKRMTALIGISLGLQSLGAPDAIQGFVDRYIDLIDETMKKIEDRQAAFALELQRQLDDIKVPTTEQAELNQRMREYEALVEGAKDEWQRLLDLERQILADLRNFDDSGLQTPMVLTSALEVVRRLRREQMQAAEEANRRASPLGQFEDDVRHLAGLMRGEFAGAFADMVTQGRFAFDQLAQSFLNDFVAVAIRFGIARLLSALGRPTPVVTTAHEVFPGLQHGGPLDAGQAAIVGEAGPELFVPSVAGTVVPNGEFGGAGVTINQSLLIQPGLSAEVRQQILAMRSLIEEWAKSAVADGVRRGGTLSGLIRGER